MVLEEVKWSVGGKRRGSGRAKGGRGGGAGELKGRRGGGLKEGGEEG